MRTSSARLCLFHARMLAVLLLTALLLQVATLAPAGAQSCPAAVTANYFERYVNVMGVHLFATPSVSDAKLEHAAAVMARYLDNDEDGVADDAAVLAAMIATDASIFMFANENDANSATNDDALMDSLTFQDLYASETVIGYPGSTNQFDFALEEVLHLVTSIGWASAYPSVFGEHAGSTLALAMDTARGGHFEESGNDNCDGGSQCALPPGGNYPAGAWYTYDDPTCDYSCMATEYIYWALTSLLGGQQAPGRPGDIVAEWQLATPAQVQANDTAITNLLTAQGYSLPTVLPDGSYAPGIGPAIDNPCGTPGGGGDSAGCAKKLRKLMTKYAGSTVKTLGKCVDGVNRGKTLGPCPDSRTQDKLDRAADKLSADRINAACAPEDLAAVGLAGDCTAASTGTQVKNCLATAGDTATDSMLDLEFADVTASSEMADQSLARCQQGLARAGAKYGSGRARNLVKCLAQRDNGKVDSCPDPKATSKLAKLLDRLDSGVDKKCSNAQAAALAATAVPGWSCAASATTAQLTDCQSVGHDSAVDTLLATLP
ncbi:MAG: hypothetical protein HRT46_00850 [Deltaproteobacteria bacterium]|nr:hypothetical protein [Deltaproteobacteria bacterium]